MEQLLQQLISRNDHLIELNARLVEVIISLVQSNYVQRPADYPKTFNNSEVYRESFDTVSNDPISWPAENSALAPKWMSEEQEDALWDAQQQEKTAQEISEILSELDFQNVDIDIR